MTDIPNFHLEEDANLTLSASRQDHQEVTFHPNEPTPLNSPKSAPGRSDLVLIQTVILT